MPVDLRSYPDRCDISHAVIAKSGTNQTKRTYPAVSIEDQPCKFSEQSGTLNTEEEGLVLDHDAVVRVPPNVDIRMKARDQEADRVEITRYGTATVSRVYMVQHVASFEGRLQQVTLTEELT